MQIYFFLGYKETKCTEWKVFCRYFTYIIKKDNGGTIGLKKRKPMGETMNLINFNIKLKHLELNCNSVTTKLLTNELKPCYV